MKKSQEGNYLIRQNSKGDKYVLVVNAGQQLVMNFIINYDNDTKKFVFGGQPHDSLELILRYLRKTPLQGKGVFRNMSQRQVGHVTPSCHTVMFNMSHIHVTASS